MPAKQGKPKRGDVSPRTPDARHGKLLELFSIDAHPSNADRSEKHEASRTHPHGIPSGRPAVTITILCNRPCPCPLTTHTHTDKTCHGRYAAVAASNIRSVPTGM